MKQDLFILFKEIYSELFKHNVYDVTGDKYYDNVHKKIHSTQDVIINHLRKVLPENELNELIDENWDNIFDYFLYYQYRDFKYYLAAGIAIGIAITKDLDDKTLQTIIQKVRNNFN